MTTPSPEIQAALAALPKIDLHRHLEGSLRLGSLQAIAREFALDVPVHDLELLRPHVQVTGENPGYRSFLDKFSVLRRFYQSPDVIRRLAYEVIEDAALDNIAYLELRFTPNALARARGFSLLEVTDWVLQAVGSACRDYPEIEVGLIVSVNRHEPVELAEQSLAVALARQERGIVGLDLAGDEVSFPAAPFRHLFQVAREAGLGVVAHAGEWTGAATVCDAIEHLGVQRIGHGVRVLEDAAAVRLARERDVLFEVCLSSNVHSGVVQRLADHPLRAMLAEGLRVTLNTDDPGVSNISLAGEYAAAIAELGLGLDDVKQSVLTAAAGAFLPPDKRAALVERFRRALE